MVSLVLISCISLITNTILYFSGRFDTAFSSMVFNSLFIRFFNGFPLGSGLSSEFAIILPFSSSTFMMIVGVIEILAGILVFIDVQKGAYLVSAWLVLIALSLLASLNYLDIAVRDLAMAIGAFSLAKISGILKN